MASNSRPGRILLSDKLRGMRFMKQKEEAALRDKLAAEKRERDKAAHWVVEGFDEGDDGRPVVISEEGVGMHAWSGRRSFGNFNKIVEMKDKEEPQVMAEVKVKEEVSVKKAENSDVKKEGKSVKKAEKSNKKEKSSVKKQKNSGKREAVEQTKQPLNKKPRTETAHVDVVDVDMEDGEIVEDEKPPLVSAVKKEGRYEERRRALWKGLKGGITKKDKKGKKAFRHKKQPSFQYKVVKKSSS